MADTRLKTLRDAVEMVVALVAPADAAEEGAGVAALGSTPDSAGQLPQPPVADALPVEDVTPADPSDALDSVAQDRPGPQEQSTPAAPGTATATPVLVPPEELLCQYLTSEFAELTASGSPTWKALIRPELFQVAEPSGVPPTKLADVWRTLHLFALRLPQEEAQRSRTRWHARAAEHLGDVDTDCLVPALPGVVEALPLRDPRSPMAPDAVREHAGALLARAKGGSTEPSDELRYVLALIQECACENLLLAQSDPCLFTALEILTGSSPERLSNDAARESYRQLVDVRLAELARSVRMGAQVEPALIKADEALAALVHDPLARPESWWHQRRRALQRKLTAHLSSRGTDVQAYEQLTAYGENDNRTRSDIPSKERSGVAILWWLRLPYQVKDGNWEKGRKIHEKFNA
ncbi:hypothetical protein AB0M39_11755 [Streptomyces sp. NPDC051907]|uniref:hypothetical protein n=1 Tax=Streptomyces sp. NPDC051907 TaxID=3155284 RepID=UPI00343E74A5